VPAQKRLQLFFNPIRVVRRIDIRPNEPVDLLPEFVRDVLEIAVVPSLILFVALPVRQSIR
jgi:hypothetical protein